MPDDLQVPQSPEVIVHNFYDQARRLRRRSSAILAFIILAWRWSSAQYRSFTCRPSLPISTVSPPTSSLDEEVRSSSVAKPTSSMICRRYTMRRQFSATATHALQNPVGAWKRENWIQNDKLNAMTIAPMANLVAVETDDTWDRGKVLIASREEGGSWASVAPRTAAGPTVGELQSVATGPDGRLVAVDHEWIDDTFRPLVPMQQGNGEWAR